MWLTVLTKWIFTKFGVGILVAAAFALTYWYVADLQQSNKALEQEVIVLEDELSSVRESYSAYKTNTEQRMVEITHNLLVLEDTRRKAKERINELENLFAEHDLEMLARKKPGLVSNRINAGTTRVYDHLEAITERFNPKQ